MSQKRWISKKVLKIPRKDGTNIHVEVRGDKGPWVFLFNGIVCHRSSWARQLEVLPKNHRLVYMDYAGHGATSAPKWRYKQTFTDVLVNDVLLVCKELKIKKMKALSHSFGSVVMFKTYLEKPSLFSSAVCIGGFVEKPLSAIKGVSSKNWVQAIEFLELCHTSQPEVFGIATKALLNNPIITLVSGLSGGFNLGRTNPSVYQSYFQGITCVDLDFVFPLFKELMSIKIKDLNKIKMPVLVLSGSRDLFTSKSQQKKLASKLPKSTYVEVLGGSHCLHLENRLSVDHLIQDFFCG